MKKNIRASITKLAWNKIASEINKVNDEIKILENGPRDKEGGREKLLGCRKRRARLGKKAKDIKKYYKYCQRILNSDFWEITEEEAIKLVVEKTRGHDGSGKPNVLHPLIVGSRGENKDERLTGYLHDLVEDTNVTWEELEKEYFVPERIIESLKLLTHDKTKPYEEYIQGIVDSGNKLALVTKIRDLEHNIQRDDSKHPDRLRKHIAAINRLLPLINKKENE